MEGGEVPTSRTPPTPEAEKKYRAILLGFWGAELAVSETELRGGAVQANSAKDRSRVTAIPQRVVVRMGRA
jgi:hypothetical protein